MKPSPSSSSHHLPAPFPRPQSCDQSQQHNPPNPLIQSCRQIQTFPVSRWKLKSSRRHTHSVLFTRQFNPALKGLCVTATELIEAGKSSLKTDLTCQVKSLISCYYSFNIMPSCLAFRAPCSLRSRRTCMHQLASSHSSMEMRWAVNNNLMDYISTHLDWAMGASAGKPSLSDTQTVNMPTRRKRHRRLINQQIFTSIQQKDVQTREEMTSKLTSIFNG